MHESDPASVRICSPLSVYNWTYIEIELFLRSRLLYIGPTNGRGSGCTLLFIVVFPVRRPSLLTTRLLVTAEKFEIFVDLHTWYENPTAMLRCFVRRSPTDEERRIHSTPEFESPPTASLALILLL